MSVDHKALLVEAFFFFNGNTATVDEWHYFRDKLLRVIRDTTDTKCSRLDIDKRSCVLPPNHSGSCADDPDKKRFR